MAVKFWEENGFHDGTLFWFLVHSTIRHTKKIFILSWIETRFRPSEYYVSFDDEPMNRIHMAGTDFPCSKKE
jgi:hypothetical protein